MVKRDRQCGKQDYVGGSKRAEITLHEEKACYCWTFKGALAETPEEGALQRTYSATKPRNFFTSTLSRAIEGGKGEPGVEAIALKLEEARMYFAAPAGAEALVRFKESGKKTVLLLTTTVGYPTT